jgi:hypothetical protein
MRPSNQLLPPPPACASCLPQTERYVLLHEQTLSIIQQVSPEKSADYLSELDWLLATFVPAMRPDIMRYYADEGPMLKHLLSREAVRQIDMTILETLERLEAAA